MDLNKIALSGLAVSDPVLTKLNGKTSLAAFSLQVNEQFVDNSGMKRVRPNIIRVEGLGRSAEAIMEKIKSGLRYYTDGYIREDDDTLKVRIFSITREDSGDGAVYMEGIKQALDILERSRDMDSALEKLRSLVAAR